MPSSFVVVVVLFFGFSITYAFRICRIQLMFLGFCFSKTKSESLLIIYDD